MLRITDDLKSIPVNAIIVCASCERAVYVVTINGSRGLTIKSLKPHRVVDSKYNIIWCSQCKCEVQLNLRILYIPPISIWDIAHEHLTLGKRIMLFEHARADALYQDAKHVGAKNSPILVAGDKRC